MKNAIAMVRRYRDALAAAAIRRLLRTRDLTVVADDCWGGRLYSQLGLRCRSPFIAMGFQPTEFLEFLTHMREPGALDPLSVSSVEKGYPVIYTRHARLYGLHYPSDADFLLRYRRRKPLIVWDEIFVKLDFGKPEYRPEDIERWNAMALPRSVALCPDEPRFRHMHIHNKVLVPGWVNDGSRTFQLSIREFDIFTWLNEGVITSSFAYRALQFALMDKWFLARCSNLLREIPPFKAWQRARNRAPLPAGLEVER